MPDPREIQINLGGFMDSYGAASFTSELWTLLLSAQETVGGVPAAVSPTIHDMCQAVLKTVHRGEKGRARTSSKRGKAPAWSCAGQRLV
jgi:hypothetical protein